MAAAKKTKMQVQQMFCLFPYGTLVRGDVTVSEVGEENNTIHVVFSQKCCNIHIFHNHTIAALITCPAGVYDACLMPCRKGGWHLWTLSTFGRIACSILPPFASENRETAELVKGHTASTDLQGPNLFRATINDDDVFRQSIYARKIIILKGYLLVIGSRENVCLVELFQLDMADTHEKIKLSELLVSYELPITNSDSFGQEADIACTFVCVSKDDSGIKPWTNLPADRVFRNKCLYKALFDVEDNLMEIPMLLIGLQSGQIYSVPIRFPYVNSQPKLLCDLQQPVVGMHGLLKRTLKDSKEGIPDGLLVVGSLGKIVMLYVWESDADSDSVLRCDTKDFFIKGPITCTLMLSGNLVHSTSNSLCVTSLTQLVKKNQYHYLESESYNIGGQITMSGTSRPNERQKQVLVWLSMTKQGWLCKFCLPVLEEAGEHETLTASSGSRSLKDLLNGIAQTTEQLDKTKDQIGIANSVLEQLALAGYIGAADSCDTLNSPSVPLLLETKVDINNLGPCFKGTLKMRLNNQSPMKLSNHWSLILTLSKWTEYEKISPIPLGNISKNVCLSELSPNEFQEVHIDLTLAHFKEMPLRIQASICYDVGSSLPKQCLGSREPVLVFGLPEQTVDVLNTLQPRMSKQWGISQTSDWKESFVEELAKQRPCAALHRVPNANISSLPSTTDSLTMSFSKDDFKDVKSLQGKRFESNLLKYILQDSGIVVSPGEASIQAQTLIHSSPVSLVIKAHQSRKIEITLQCSDLLSLVQLRMAVSYRLQKLYRQRNKSEALEKQVYKSVEHDASILRDEMCETGKASKELIQKVVNLYTKLRRT